MINTISIIFSWVNEPAVNNKTTVTNCGLAGCLQYYILYYNNYNIHNTVWSTICDCIVP